MAGTSDIKLDLHAIVDRLWLLKADLQSYCDDSLERYDVPRQQLAIAIRQVSERAMALEDLVMRVGASVVIVTMKRAAAESLRCAVHRFDRLDLIDDAKPVDDVVSCVIDALHAADVICLRAAGGRPDVAVRHDVRVERLARPDGSRTAIVVARIGPPPPVPVADERAAGSVAR
jgi:hypothetical protein